MAGFVPDSISALMSTYVKFIFLQFVIFSCKIICSKKFLNRFAWKIKTQNPAKI